MADPHRTTTATTPEAVAKAIKAANAADAQAVRVDAAGYVSAVGTPPAPAKAKGKTTTGTDK